MPRASSTRCVRRPGREGVLAARDVIPSARTSAGDDGGFQVVVMAKYPAPGTVKTRLARQVGAEGAAELSAAFMRDLDARLRASGLAVVWAVWPVAAPFERVLPGARYFTQEGADLGERMAWVAERVLAEQRRPVVLLGADVPHLDIGIVRAAGALLAAGDAEFVLGPADDGGYYLLGLRQFVPAVFRGIEWGGCRVCAETEARLGALGVRYRLLETSFDVDRPADLVRLVELIDAGGIALPHTAAVLERLGIK
jgi:rSAM/selenodomain-associated transferase 1